MNQRFNGIGITNLESRKEIVIMQLKPDMWDEDTKKAAWWGGLHGLLIGICLSAFYFYFLH